MATSPSLRIALLGQPVVEVDGRPLDVDTRKATALLAFLSVNDGTARRDTIAALLWPDAGPDRARAALRRTLSTLRAALGDRWLHADRERIRLDREGVTIDVDELRRLVGSCAGHGHPGGATCPRCVDPLRAAAALDRGPFLEGFGLRDSAAFDDWLHMAGSELRREVASALDRLADALTAVGDHGGAVAAARRRLALDPLHEPAHRQLIAAYAAAGERLAALEQYRECVRVLDRELGVRPLDETTGLYHAVLEGSIPAPASSPPESEPPTSERYPLVGREGSLQSLRAALGDVGPSGRVVGLAGEAGIGKTRLADELVAEAAAAGRVAITVRGFAEESELAFGVVTSLLRAALAVRPPGRDGWWRAEAARLLPELGAPPGEPLASAGAQARFFEGVAEVLTGALGGERPGVVVVDDLQWADEASLSLLAYVVNRLGDRPLLLVLAWRDDEIEQGHPVLRLVSDARRSGTGRLVRLERLSSADVAALVRSTGRGEELGERLHEVTGGLPFFLVEYLDALGRGDEDAWIMPGGVRELLLSRLASVGELASQVVAAASVVGGAVDGDVLREASGRSDEEMVQALDELVAKGVLVETADGACEFRHDQARELVYSGLTRARRRLLHRRAATALDAHGSRDAEPAVIARHLELAGDELAAAALHRTAGDRARTLYANVEALGHYTSALALGDQHLSELHAAIGDLQTLAGDYGSALASYETAAAHASAAALPEIEHRIGLLHLRRGAWDLADAALASALGELTGGARARALADRSLAAHRAGRAADAEKLAQDALALAESSADRQALAQARNILGMLALSRGDELTARAQLEQSLALARDAEDRGAEVAALNNLALALLAGADHEAAMALTTQALDLCVRLGDRHREAALRNNRADQLHAAGRDDEAMLELKRAVAIFAEVGDEGELEPEIWKLSEW